MSCMQVCGSISREDVAELAIKALLSDKANGKILTAIDKDKVFGGSTYEVYNL